ncbi:hypothetical protein HDU96_005514, partial [Phlyctochytrium bullatum]
RYGFPPDVRGKLTFLKASCPQRMHSLRKSSCLSAPTPPPAPRMSRRRSDWPHMFSPRDSRGFSSPRGRSSKPVTSPASRRFTPPPGS